MSKDDVRRYRDEGDVSFAVAVPPPDGLHWRIDLEDQGLEIAVSRTPLNLWEIRVNAAGGADIIFPSVPKPGPPALLKVQLKWKRGGQMVLWLNDKLIGMKPFSPPALS